MASPADYMNHAFLFKEIAKATEIQRKTIYIYIYFIFRNEVTQQITNIGNNTGENTSYTSIDEVETKASFFLAAFWILLTYFLVLLKTC